MRYKDATAFRQALEDRLKTRAKGDGAALARDRKRVAFDRLLARLLAVAPEQWLLKGGFALELRLAERARATKDVDIDWQADEEQLLDTLIDAASHDAGDFFVFTVERTSAPEDRLGGSHRFRVVASLAGRLFEMFLLDVGFRRDEQVVADISPPTIFSSSQRSRQSRHRPSRSSSRSPRSSTRTHALTRTAGPALAPRTSSTSPLSPSYRPWTPRRFTSRSRRPSRSATRTRRRPSCPSLRESGRRNTVVSQKP